MLLNLNTSSISSISATINGSARLADAGSEEESFFKQQHLDNNTFEDSSAGASIFNSTPADGARPTFVEGEDVRVVVVKIQDVRISDWKGSVRDYVIVPSEPMVNGV